MVSGIDIESTAFLYAKGIFTTIAIRNAKPLVWEKHWRRLSENAGKIGLDISALTEPIIRGRFDKALIEGKIINGRARITLYDESASPIWSTPGEPCTGLSIITGECRSIPENFKLAVSPFPINSRSPLAGVKSCNYLENILALDEAKRRGFHEAIRLNEIGQVASACMANVFWSVGKDLFTPALSTGCLAGTTREFVLENIEFAEVETGIDELTGADAIYLTSAGIGVKAVAEFDGRKLSTDEHAIMEILSGWR